MMKTIYNILTAGALALMILNSCDEPYQPFEETKDEGQLSTKDFVLEIVESATRAVTDVNEFTVKVVDIENKTPDKSWKYSEMPGVITLPVGNYRIEAYNEEVQDAAWDAPYYYNDKNITILKDKLESLGAMKCALCNVKVSVSYEPKLLALLEDDATVTAKFEDASEKSLVYTLKQVEGKIPGYFKYEENAKTLVLEFTGTVKGSAVKAYKVSTEVKPGEHHVVTFSLKDTPDIPGESGYISSTGTLINSTVTVEDVNSNVNPGNDPLEPYEVLTISKNKVSLMADGGEAEITVSAKGRSGWYITGAPEWLTVTPASGSAGQETATDNAVVFKADANPDNNARTATLNVRMARITKTVTVTQTGNGGVEPSEDMPTITSETIELDTPIDITNVTNANKMPFNVKMTAPKGFKNIFVTIDSPTLTKEELVSMGLDSNFDLAHPGNMEEGLHGLGFPVGDEVLGKTETSFDITDFVPLIPILGNGRSVFEITVVDNDDQKTTSTIIMVVNK